jgi:hypothetical protein
MYITRARNEFNRSFTAQLARLYKELHVADKKFGVLFVTNNDWDQKTFQECVQSVDRCIVHHVFVFEYFY